MAQVWRLKNGKDLRLRQGHPWIYAEDLEVHPRNFNPLELVEIQDHRGAFLARGYGNLESQIVFRALSFLSSEKNPLSLESLKEKVLKAWRRRFQRGLRHSFRLVFSEADELSGLVVDRYTVKKEGTQFQVFAVQILTAGMERCLGDLVGFFQFICQQALSENLSSIPWEKSAVVLRNDVSVRQREGLEVEPPRFVKSFQGLDFENAWIEIESVGGGDALELQCDLYQGQKTGFFLDQRSNIQAVAQILNGFPQRTSQEPFRILDLCCYVGHWSAQLGVHLKKKNWNVEVNLVDVSKEALRRAQENCDRLGLKVNVFEKDVLKDLDSLPSQSFDLVVADPPAFAKSKKDLPTARHAYLKLNSQAFRLVKGDGHVVSCSCSGLIREEDLLEALRKAQNRNGLFGQIIARGGSSLDHPALAGFPEGQYLKMFVHSLSGSGAKALF